MRRLSVRSTRILVSVGLSLCLALLFGTAASSKQAARTPAAKPLPKGAFAQNVDFIGSDKLNGLSGFKLDIQQAAGKWYLYLAHVWTRGWSIVDVTDPSAPKYLKLVAPPPNTATSQLTWAANGRMLTPVSGGAGTDRSKPFEGGFITWDLTDPTTPKRVGQWKSLGNHRDAYDGGRYVYAAASEDGFQGGILVIVDVSDLTNPVEVSRWWMPGQKKGERFEKPTDVGAAHHGGPVQDGNLLYLPYGGAGLVILDIGDIRNPRFVGQLDFSPPFKSGLGLHSVTRLPDRNGKKYVLVNSEADHGCPDESEVMQLAGIVDVTDPKQPFMVGELPRPVPPPGYPQADFCDHGQFGPHNPHTLASHPYVEKQGDLVYLTYQTGGLQIFDIADVRAPKIVGYFVPPDPTAWVDGPPATSGRGATRVGEPQRNPIKGVLYAVTENVLVDARHYIYIVDRNSPWNLMVLRYTGPKSPWRAVSD